MPTRFRYPESHYTQLPNGDIWKGVSLEREREDSASAQYLTPNPEAIAKQNKELEKIAYKTSG